MEHKVRQLSSKLAWLLLVALLLPACAAFWIQPPPPAPRSSSSSSTVTVPPPRILILPGFGNESSDYTFLEDEGSSSLVSCLKRRGWDNRVDVLPVRRIDWLQVFLRGLLDGQFWRANAAPTRPAFAWYLQRIADYVKTLEPEESVILVGHSAGGWLARAAVGFGQEGAGMDSDNKLGISLDKILGIVTLGAPNQPPPPGVMDMTRGALRITNENFPGAFHAPLMFYVTVIGNSVRGRKQERTSPFEPTTRDGFAFNSYEAVCGDGTTVGDGVVPICAAHVEDALQLELDGVFHSMNVPKQWYGSESVIDLWHGPMMDELDRLLRWRQRERTFRQSFLSALVGGNNQ